MCARPCKLVFQVCSKFNFFPPTTMAISALAKEDSDIEINGQCEREVQHNAWSQGTDSCRLKSPIQGRATATPSQGLSKKAVGKRDTTSTRLRRMDIWEQKNIKKLGMSGCCAYIQLYSASHEGRTKTAVVDWGSLDDGEDGSVALRMGYSACFDIICHSNRVPLYLPKPQTRGKHVVSRSDAAGEGRLQMSPKEGIKVD